MLPHHWTTSGTTERMYYKNYCEHRIPRKTTKQIHPGLKPPAKNGINYHQQYHCLNTLQSQLGLLEMIEISHSHSRWPKHPWTGAYTLWHCGFQSILEMWQQKRWDLFYIFCCSSQDFFQLFNHQEFLLLHLFAGGRNRGSYSPSI